MVTYVFAGIPVADRQQAVSWYERLIGRPADLIPNMHEAAWQMTGTGWIYVVADPDRAGSALNTLLVDDLEGFVAGLTERGITASPIETNAASVRVTLSQTPMATACKSASRRADTTAASSASRWR